MPKENPPQPLAERPKKLRRIDGLKTAGTLECCGERISHGLSRRTFLEVLEYVGKFSVIIGFCNFQGACLSPFEFGKYDFPRLVQAAYFRNASFFSGDSINPYLGGNKSKVGEPDGARLAMGTNENDVNDFKDCSFVGVSFHNSRWDGVDFEKCNFAFADLGDIELNTNSAALNNCNLYAATNASPAFVVWAGQQSLVFTNITSKVIWDHWVSEPGNPPPVPQSEFLNWASNQWVSYYNHTNTSQAWLAWSRANLHQ